MHILFTALFMLLIYCIFDIIWYFYIAMLTDDIEMK